MEHTVGRAFPEGFENLSVIKIHLGKVNFRARVFADLFDRIFYYGKVSESKEIHLEKSELFERLLGVLRRDIILGAEAQGYILFSFVAAYDNCCGMGGRMSRKSFEFPRHIDDPLNIRVFVVSFLKFGN